MNEDAMIRRANLIALKLTPKDLARRAGYGRYTYWRDLMENDKKSFGEKAARRLEEALELSPRGCLDDPDGCGKLHKRDRQNVTNVSPRPHTPAHSGSTEIDPMVVLPNISDTLTHLARQLVALRPMSRAGLVVPVTKILEHPDDPHEAIALAESIVNSSQAPHEASPTVKKALGRPAKDIEQQRR